MPSDRHSDAQAQDANNKSASAFLTTDEAARLRERMTDDSLIGRSLRAERAQLDGWMRQAIAIPGSGPGGGEEHEQHKQNYLTLFAAGRQWMITQEPAYAARIRDTLLAYAEIYTDLPYAKPFSINPPGRLFHQILNEHMWLLFSSAGYSCIRHTLPQAERDKIEAGVFAPMVEMFTKTYHDHFDIIHNHGMWACAAVGIAGISCQRRDWLEMSVLGQFGDSQTAGFLAQLSQLFSPSGYYEEGPYYQRFAIQPMLLFAEAIERAWPEIGIYQHHDQIVRRGFYAAFLPSFPNGALVPLNDSIKPMNIKSLGFVIGASLMYRRYASDHRLTWLADQHQSVWCDGAGVLLSDALIGVPVGSIRCELPSTELLCGAKGDRGAIGVIRSNGRNGEQSVMTLDAGAHGLAEHAHFDALTLGYFNRGQEVLRDYGCVRWINIEPKGGGAYLPENISFAKQSIAHNTITVDGHTYHAGDADAAVKNPARRVSFKGEGEAQMMCGEIANHYPGVNMRRSAVLLRHNDFEHPLLIDVCQITADSEHQYDYSLYYQGQVVRSDFEYQLSSEMRALGDCDGYQHLWRQGSGNIPEGHGLFSWLQDKSYYSLNFASSNACELIFTRIGANDPQFNLRNEPGIVLRQNGRDAVVACVLETHGVFEESIELSRNARGVIEGIRVLSNSPNAISLRLQGAGRAWQVEINNETGEVSIQRS